MSDTSKRDAVLKEFMYSDEYRAVNHDAMAAEIVKLRAILAKLREPSNAVVLAADKKIPILYRLRDTKAGIIAAVAAAEQEVGG